MALKHLHPQHHLHSFTLCNSPSSLSQNFNHGFKFLLPKYPFKHSPLLHIQSHFTTYSAANQQQPNISRRILDKIEKGFSSFGDKDQRVSKKIEFLGQNGSEKGKNVTFEDKDQRVPKKVTFLGENLDNGNGVGSNKVKNGKKGKKVAFLGDRMDNENARKKPKNNEVDSSFECKERMGSKKAWLSGDKLDSENGVDGKRFKKPKKGKLDSPVVVLRIGLEICSKLGDVMGAIGIFDLAKKEGIALGQYHYAVILYLCSSAAVGVVQPAKSGRSGTNLDEKSRLFEEPSGELDRVSQTLDDVIQLINDHENSKGRTRIEVGDNVKEYALKRGFEIYEEMISDDVPMNEAILTSLARMAMSRNDGDMAFDMVKKMKDLGINPRLRSYGPALSVFCNNGNLDKAFEVEEHMLSHGVYPEEPELELLLRVSIEASRSDKVYYVLHKLRTGVRKVLPSTADVIEKWFNSKTASRVGKRKWDQQLINKAVVNGGGGWHGQGWLGSGKWNVKRSFVGKDGLCKCCGEKLVTIDLDPVETERFAESVAKIAKQRDRNSNFEKFQKWLDYYGPFEAVVDGANVGLFSQRRFKPSKVNTIANGIRQMLPSKKWPLVILHNRRITGDKMDEGLNKTLVEKWKTADALYATPTGSNDDWYWLYAAIKFKCLLVTNDEMRDHLFQLLGNDFFPKWKERHQVRFNFSDTGPVYHMPPPCSVVIQESSKGHWHIPIASEQDSEEERVWMCVTRDKSSRDSQESINVTEESGQKELPGSDFGTKNPQKTQHKHTPQEVHGSLRKTLLSSLPIKQDTLLTRITAAEKLSQSTIDFQI